jgi:hypothetical protein
MQNDHRDLGEVPASRTHDCDETGLTQQSMRKHIAGVEKEQASQGSHALTRPNYAPDIKGRDV